MGENNTAGLDPIFFFHHCFIDYAFWSWQRKSKLTKRGDLTVDWGYAGTNSSDGAGAPAFQAANVFIDMDTPLYPFRKSKTAWMTSNDVTDIEELGYTYWEGGSLERLVSPVHMPASGEAPEPLIPSKVLRVSSIGREKYEGSFVIRTVIKQDGKEYEVGREPILSRWKVQGCRNCQNHLETRSFVPVHKPLFDLLGGTLTKATIVVNIQTHGGAIQGTADPSAAAPSLTAPGATDPPPLVEII